MQRQEKPFRQWQTDKMVAKCYYRHAFWTSLSPALILFSLMSFSIGKNFGGDPTAWFMYYWPLKAAWLVCALGLLCFGVVEVLQGLRRASKFT